MAARLELLGGRRGIWDASFGLTDERGSVVVDARPEPLAIELATTAVIVVDMQNDFGAEGGMFARAGIPIADIATVVEPIARVLAAARRAGVTVVYLTMQFESDLSNAGAPDSPNFLKHKASSRSRRLTRPFAPPPTSTTAYVICRRCTCHSRASNSEESWDESSRG